jgi:excisionase family DNA binding protein
LSEPLLRAHDVAELLAISPATVLDWFEAGKLPGFRLGGRKGGPVRFRLSEIEAQLEGWRCDVASSSLDIDGLSAYRLTVKEI